jgi:hypothetical protein
MTKTASIKTDDPLVIRGPSVGILGEIRGIMRNPDGSVAQDTGWIKNKILDQGLFWMGQMNNWGSKGHIGSDATPVVTGGIPGADTGLRGWMAYVSGQTLIEKTAQPVAPTYEGYDIYRYRFNAGVGVGTVREFGISPYSTNNLTTRVLVTPEMPKSAVQVLDVYYKMTCYPDLTEYTGTIDINIDGVVVPYNVISRGQKYGDQYTNVSINSTVMGGFSGNIGRRFFDGNLGAGLTGYPSGTTAGGYPNYLQAGYIGAGTWGETFAAGVDSCYKDIYLAGDLDTGNISSGLGIRSAYIDFGLGYDWGVQYDRVSDGSRIMKDNTKIIQLNYRYTWSRL